MSNRLKCCCDVVGTYWLLRPCFNEEVTEQVYMSSADFKACGFSPATIYSWDTGNPADDPYCGFWVFNKTVTGDRLDSTCGNYSANAEGCCGGDCLPDINCCGFDQCFDWYEANSFELVDVTGFSGGGGSTTGWSVSVANVSVSNGYWSAGAFKYDVTVEVTISVANIGNLSCDGSGTFTADGQFTFTVTHDKSLGCLSTATSSAVLPNADCDIRLCEGTTSNGTTDSSDCSKITPSVQSATVSTPDLGNDCLTQAAYSIAVPINYSLNPGDLNICLDCDSVGRWSGAAFPDLFISTTLTLSGTWAP